MPIFKTFRQLTTQFSSQSDFKGHANRAGERLPVITLNICAFALITKAFCLKSIIAIFPKCVINAYIGIFKHLIEKELFKSNGLLYISDTRISGVYFIYVCSLFSLSMRCILSYTNFILHCSKVPLTTNTSPEESCLPTQRIK